MPVLHRRFQALTLGFFKKHGIEDVGVWEAVVGPTGELQHIVHHDDRAQRERAWGAFAAEEGWLIAGTRANTTVSNQFWAAGQRLASAVSTGDVEVPPANPREEDLSRIRRRDARSRRE